MLDALRQRCPCICRAKLTFRGLTVRNHKSYPAALRGRMFPWLTLMPRASTWWTPVDDEGRPVQFDGRTLVLRVPDTRKSKLVQRLYERALKRAWANGTFSMIIDYWPERQERAHMRLISVFICIGAIALLIQLASSIPNLFSWPIGAMPTHILVATVLVIASVLALFGTMVGAIVWAAWRTQPDVARRIHCTMNAMDVALEYRGSRRYDWGNLTDVQSRWDKSIRLIFAKNDLVVLPGGYQSRRLVTLLREHVLNRQMTRSSVGQHERRWEMQLAARTTMLVLPLSLALAWYLTTYFPSSAPTGGLYRVVGPFWSIVIQLAVLPMMMWFVVGVTGITRGRYGRRLRFRGRRKARGVFTGGVHP